MPTKETQVYSQKRTQIQTSIEMSLTAKNSRASHLRAGMANGLAFVTVKVNILSYSGTYMSQQTMRNTRYMCARLFFIKEERT
jgi:hypothetical protein